MKLEPLPEILVDEYDEDSLIFRNDKEFYYNSKFNKKVVDDIKRKNLQIYEGYYHFQKGWNTPKIYLLGRGVKSGKFKIKVEGFCPYCYIKDKDGKTKSYLGTQVEKILFKGMHPNRVKIYRDTRRKKGWPLPYEADILFVRRFLIDTYDYFKSDKPIQPKVAILDVETDNPVSDDLIAWSINDQENNIWYGSKYDTSYPSEIALDIYERLLPFDVVTGWSIGFDIGCLCKDNPKSEDEALDKIDHFIDYARQQRDLTKEQYIEGMGDRYFCSEESKNIIEQLLIRGYLKEENGKVVLGEKEFNPNLYEQISVIDMLPLSKKMHAQEIRGKWSLGNVGVQMAGIDKFHLGATRIGDLDEQTLMEYNVRDVIIPEILDNYLGGIEAHVILGWSLQSTLEDMKITAVVNDIAMLRAYHREGIVLPTRDFSEKQDEVKYKAAEPDARPGVYEGLITLDLKHAYPSAVISKNISPETKDQNGENLTPNGVRYNNDHSVFIDTLKEIMVERGKVKSELKKHKKRSSEYRRLKSIDFALKTQAAAFSHGIFGWANSRMRDYQVADSITAIVREIINTIKKACDVIDLKWVYCHTDSIYVSAKKEDLEGVSGYLNDIINDYCCGDVLIPELEIKGFYPNAYIHSPARNVLVPEDSTINDDETWDVTGCNFMRSETPIPLAEIEVNMIKLKMRGASKESMLYQLKKNILELKDKESVDLGTIKPLSKPIDDYGKTLMDGSYGNVPYHIKALLKSQKEYGFMVDVGDKFCIIPIITDETVGVKKVRRKKVFIAFPIETGLPDNYKIDFENYLKSSLFGKINGLFDMTPRELEKSVMIKEIKEKLNGGK